MRITSSMLASNFMTNIQSNLQRMEKYQNQISTGKNFSRPSDDPVAVTRSLQVRTDLSKTDQYLKNVRDGITWLDQSETSLMEINVLIGRAYDLSVDAANGTKTPEDRQIIAKEALQIQEQLVQAANASYAGRYLFGGYNTASKPFELKGSPGAYTLSYNGKDMASLMDPDPANVAWLNNAKTQNINYAVGNDVKMSVSFTGIDLFGAGADNLFEVINQFSSALLDGSDQSAIGESIGKLQQQQNQILSLIGETGGKYNRLTLMEKRYDLDHYNFKAVQSKIEDADYAKATIDSKMAEVVYQSALSAAAKIIQPTLMDFLR